MITPEAVAVVGFAFIVMALAWSRQKKVPDWR